MSTNRRSLYFLTVLFVLALAAIPTTSAPPAADSSPDANLVVGRNVNVVAGTQLPGGDPYLQRQNEPSIAASTRNPLHLMAGMNDYRTIDMPFDDQVPGQEIGNQAMGRDAWLGIAKSFNGGQSWTTTLLPGFPQDISSTSPLKLFGTAADPVVRAGTNGLFYLAGIAFNRVDRGSGVVFVARFIDLNNKENTDTIKYDGVSIVDQGNAGQFLDKPWMAVDIPREGHESIYISGQEDPVPCGNVYVAYSAFVGKADLNIRSKIYIRRSRDCGRTWDPAIKISESQHTDQGTAIAIDPETGAVYVTWRRFATASQANAILFVKSVDGGATFTKPAVIRTLALSFPAGPGGPFDQRTTAETFRTNSHPTITVDQNGTIYVAWAERQADRQAKIMLAYSTNGGSTWSNPGLVDGNAFGHQYMPSLAFAGGRVMLMWYDQRNDEANVAAEDFIADITGVHRHTVDVRAARIDPANGGDPIVHASKQVSRYRYNLVNWTDEGVILEKTEHNYTGLTMFAKGTVPFGGDYIDLAPAPAFLPTADGDWKYNSDPVDPMDGSRPLVTPFHLAWQDTRDVKLPGGLWPNWSLYRAPQSIQNDTNFPSPGIPQDCDYTGMMNQNVYTACVTPGFVAFSPGNTKPLDLVGALDSHGFPIARAFTVTVKNMTDDDRDYHLTIEAPPGVNASFVQYFDVGPWGTPPDGFPDGFPVIAADVAVASQSSLSRPVFVYPNLGNQHATIKIHVTDMTDAASPVSIVTLNPDPTTPALVQPDTTVPLPHVKGEEVHNPHVKGVSVKNDSQEFLINPHVKGYDYVNADTAAPHVKGEVLNPHVKGLDIEAPHVKGSSISEITWEVTNEGNTTTPYTFDTFVTYNAPDNVPLENAIQFQLLIYKVYETPVANGCALGTQEHHELVVNIPNPHVKGPHVKGTPPNGFTAASAELPPPDVKDATFWLNPKEKALVVLWAIDPNPGDGNDFSFGPTGGEEVFDDVEAVAEVQSQAHNTLDLHMGDYSLPTDMSAPAGPVLISPAPGAELDNGCETSPLDGTIEWDFSWTGDPNATAYQLYVLGPEATVPMINVSLGPTMTHHFSGPGSYIIEDNRFGWIWMVRALVGGSWTAWSEVRSFDVEPPTDCPVVATPEINIQQGGQDIDSDAIYDFGDHALGSDTPVTFTIQNLGATADLLLTGAPIVSISGADAGQFVIEDPPVTTVGASQSTTFLVRFQPTSPGAKTAAILIGNDDPDEDPYVIHLTGNGAPLGGLVAFYPFNGNANDESGNGNDGTVNGATLTADRFGNSNAAYSFNGVDNGIVIPNSPSLNVANFQGGYTMTAWVRLMGAPPSQDDYAVVVDKGQGVFILRSRYDLGVEACHTDAQGAVTCLQPDLNFSMGMWAFVAVTWDGTSGQLTLYFDGQVASTLTVVGLQPYGSGSDGNVTIGRESWYERWYFNGQIDEVRLYNRTLSAAEVLWLFNQ